MTLVYPSATGSTTNSLSGLLPTLYQGKARAERKHEPVLVSYTHKLELQSDLPSLFEAAGQVFDTSCYISLPSATNRVLAGCGIEASWTFGPEVRRRWAQLLDEAVLVLDGDDSGITPVLLGGSAFDHRARHTDLWRDFPDSLLFLPRLQFTQANGARWLTCNLLVWPDDSPGARATEIESLFQALLEQASEHRIEPPRVYAFVEDVSSLEWKRMVAQAVSEIERSNLRKVVLARPVTLHLDGGVSVGRVLRHLSERYGECTLFALTRNGSTFLGATPETLVSVREQMAYSGALAGTRPRGADASEDMQLAAELFASAKDRDEHQIVLDDIRAALGQHCVCVISGEAPQVVRLPNVQHLYTPVEAELERDKSLLDLVAVLHPTPAVGGLPHDEALDAIRHLESFDRGWYAGTVGYIDGCGNGQFAVAIRSALLTNSGRRATVYAGCGIVADSDPDREYEESRAKLQPMLEAFGG